MSFVNLQLKKNTVMRMTFTDLNTAAKEHGVRAPLLDVQPNITHRQAQCRLGGGGLAELQGKLPFPSWAEALHSRTA